MDNAEKKTPSWKKTDMIIVMQDEEPIEVVTGNGNGIFHSLKKTKAWEAIIEKLGETPECKTIEELKDAVDSVIPFSQMKIYIVRDVILR